MNIFSLPSPYIYRGLTNHTQQVTVNNSEDDWSDFTFKVQFVRLSYCFYIKSVFVRLCLKRKIFGYYSQELTSVFFQK